MAALVDEQTIRTHIESLVSAASERERELESAQRWPWKRSRVPQMLYELAQSYVIIGINCCTVGEQVRASDAFGKSARFASQRFELLDRVFLGYHDVQILAAGVVGGHEEVTSNAARRALTVSGERADKVQIDLPNVAARSLLGWYVRDSSVLSQPRASERSSHFEQFELWVDIARSATKGDVAATRRAFESLAMLVAKEVRSGEFRYSEDRLAYLPGQMIVKIAMRDGMSLSVPPQAWWKTCEST